MSYPQSDQSWPSSTGLVPQPSARTAFRAERTPSETGHSTGEAPLQCGFLRCRCPRSNQNPTAPGVRAPMHVPAAQARHMPFVIVVCFCSTKVREDASERGWVVTSRGDSNRDPVHNVPMSTHWKMEHDALARSSHPIGLSADTTLCSRNN